MRHVLGRVVAPAPVATSGPEEVIIGLLDRHAADRQQITPRLMPAPTWSLFRLKEL